VPDSILLGLKKQLQRTRIGTAGRIPDFLFCDPDIKCSIDVRCFVTAINFITTGSKGQGSVIGKQIRLARIGTLICNRSFQTVLRFRQGIC